MLHVHSCHFTTPSSFEAVDTALECASGARHDGRAVDVAKGIPVPISLSRFGYALQKLYLEGSTCLTEQFMPGTNTNGPDYVISRGPARKPYRENRARLTHTGALTHGAPIMLLMLASLSCG